MSHLRQTHCQLLGFDAGVVAWDLVLNQIWPEITESQMVDYDSFMSNYIDVSESANTCLTALRYSA